MPLTQQSGSCVDCKQPSNYKVCPPCLKSRKPCARATCSSKLSRSSPYSCCYNCTCASKCCANPRDEGDALYCISCTNEWDVVCHMCQTQKTMIPFKTCNKCDEKRQQCLRCNKRKALFDITNDVSFNYCKFCKCKTFECRNMIDDDGESLHCKACQNCFCIKCQKGFAQLGSDLCRSCKSLSTQNRCGNAKCSNRVGYNQSSQSYYEFCKFCQ